MLLNTEQSSWTYEEIVNSYVSNFKQTEKIINETEGAFIWNHLTELQDCVALLESFIGDVLNNIASFSHASIQSDFWYPINSQNMHQYRLLICKSIFGASASTMALVDHVRRFSKKHPVPNEQEERINVFGKSGIHDFIQGLRNYILHVKLAEANWIITRDFEKGTRNVNFYFYKKELDKYKNWNPRAKKFIEENEDKIDVYNTFDIYLKNVKRYYDWHKNSVVRVYDTPIQQHFSNIRKLNSFKERTRWNLNLSEQMNNSQFFSLLSKNISDASLQRIYSFKMNSTEQFEEILNTIDPDDNFGERLKGKIFNILKNT